MQHKVTGAMPHFDCLRKRVRQANGAENSVLHAMHAGCHHHHPLMSRAGETPLQEAVATTKAEVREESGCSHTTVCGTGGKIAKALGSLPLRADKDQLPTERPQCGFIILIFISSKDGNINKTTKSHTSIPSAVLDRPPSQPRAAALCDKRHHQYCYYCYD